MICIIFSQRPGSVRVNKLGDVLIEDEKIKPIIDKVYPFSESVEAFTHLATGRAKGKIVVKVS